MAKKDREELFLTELRELMTKYDIQIGTVGYGIYFDKHAFKGSNFYIQIDEDING